MAKIAVNVTDACKGNMWNVWQNKSLRNAVACHSMTLEFYTTFKIGNLLLSRSKNKTANNLKWLLEWFWTLGVVYFFMKYFLKRIDLNNGHDHIAESDTTIVLCPWSHWSGWHCQACLFGIGSCRIWTVVLPFLRVHSSIDELVLQINHGSSTSKNPTVISNCLALLNSDLALKFSSRLTSEVSRLVLECDVCWLECFLVIVYCVQLKSQGQSCAYVRYFSIIFTSWLFLFSGVYWGDFGWYGTFVHLIVLCKFICESCINRWKLKMCF